MAHGYLRNFVKDRISCELEFQGSQSLDVKKGTGQVADVQDLVQRSRIVNSNRVLAGPGDDSKGQFLCPVENTSDAGEFIFWHLKNSEVIGRGNADLKLGWKYREAEKGGE